MLKLKIEKKALKDLYKISKKDREVIVKNIKNLPNQFRYGWISVKKLKGGEAFRMRVGSFRILFMLEKGDIVIYAIRRRKDAY